MTIIPRLAASLPVCSACMRASKALPPNSFCRNGQLKLICPRSFAKPKKANMMMKKLLSGRTGFQSSAIRLRTSSSPDLAYTSQAGMAPARRLIAISGTTLISTVTIQAITVSRRSCERMEGGWMACASCLLVGVDSI